jgi:aarF domain-containing kinase
LTQLAEIVFPGFKYKWYGQELNKMLPKELDFTGEAKNAKKTGELFKNNNNIRVPKVYPEYSNDKVIIMEYIDGVAVTKTKEIQEMGINLKDVSKLLNHCFSQQIFEFGHVHGDPHPGNIFVTPEKDSTGKIKPIITLLDHGLYQDLTEDVKLHYSYLWKGILTRNEDMIRVAAKNLNVEQFYQLLAIMVAKKDYKDIMDIQEKDYNKRLKAPTKEEQLAMMKQVDAEILKEITVLFSQMNKEVLLLFKVNDFIRVITSRLGSPVKHYEIMAKYCFNTIERKELEDDKTLSRRFRFWLQRSTTLFAFKLYGFYYSVLSFFKTPEVPDEILV